MTERRCKCGNPSMPIEAGRGLKCHECYKKSQSKYWTMYTSELNPEINPTMTKYLRAAWR